MKKTTVKNNEEDAYGEKTTKQRSEVQKAEREGSIADFMKYYKKLSAAFYEHRILAHWQAEAFDNCIDFLEINHIAVLIDYSMNYSHNHFNSVQVRTSCVSPLTKGKIHITFWCVL